MTLPDRQMTPPDRQMAPPVPSGGTPRPFAGTSGPLGRKFSRSSSALLQLSLNLPSRENLLAGMNEQLNVNSWLIDSASETLLCRKQVMKFLAVSSTQFWRLRRFHSFPEGIMLSPGIRRWRMSAMIEWLERRSGEAEGADSLQATGPREQRRRLSRGPAAVRLMSGNVPRG